MAAPGASKPRVFSGIQPSGGLHLGNYLGAIRNWVRDQDKYDNIFCIVDLHAMTLPYDPSVLQERILDLAATYLAAGISEQHAAIFVQSHIPAHSELAWVLECYTPMGWLERMVAFKEKAGRQSHERVGSGLLVYPVLQAADILLYDTNLVPVGEDQRQHIELTRDIGQRINQRFGPIFTMPDALIQKAGARIMGLDNPETKMSKSLAIKAPGHAIFMLDSPDTIRKKFARAQTDAEPAVRFPAGAGVANLLEIYRTICGKEWAEVEQEFAGKPYSVLKGRVADAVIEALAPIQERYRAIRSDDPALMRRLRSAADRLSPTANATLARVQRAVGLR
ncbi:MAG: tryptophan--tRNA ligase [Chloroflexi bacterium]|nr:MAG: tryptophan--tRNA ligase [Chloroflexota bacterium]TME48610.1 MAG: tryptophan--tRNA ligase [Chloroflexota bacterium]